MGEYDKPPAYPQAAYQHPQHTYDSGSSSMPPAGYPPQQQLQNYQPSPGMTYSSPTPMMSSPGPQHPGGYYGSPPPQQGGYGYPPPQPGYPPQQQGYYPPQQPGAYYGAPQPAGYYPDSRDRGGRATDGCLGGILAALACCCCLDCIF